MCRTSASTSGAISYSSPSSSTVLLPTLSLLPVRQYSTPPRPPVQYSSTLSKVKTPILQERTQRFLSVGMLSHSLLQDVGQHSDGEKPLGSFLVYSPSFPEMIYGIWRVFHVHFFCYNLG